MANGKLELKCDANVVVGASATNRITLTVRCQERVEGLIATLSIPCGAKEGTNTYLLGSTSEEIHVSESSGFNSQPDDNDNKVWKARGFALDAENPLTVEISEFSASQGDGDAVVTLQIRKKSDQLVNEACRIPVKLPKKEDEPYVHHFAADRISKVYSDKTPIEFSSYTTNAKRLKLRNTTGEEWIVPDWTIDKAYKVNNEVMYLDEPYVCVEAHTATRENREDSCPGKSKYWQHLKTDRAHKFYLVPPKTSTYTLEAWLDEITNDPQFAKHAVSKEVTVTVEQEGETSVVFQKQGCPLLLLTGDLKGAGKHSLYGVFVKDTAKPAVLWSMKSPMGWWAPETTLTPEMGQSPGVITDEGQLWLIGGSSTNPKGPRSSRVCCYRKNKKNDLAWENLPDAPFPARMGHACVVFQGKLWVLGGLDENNQPLNDVWKCTVNNVEKDDGTLIPPVWELVSENATSGSKWTPRCMFAAAVKSRSENTYFPNESLWICGGTPHPYRKDVAADLWRTEDGKQWINETSKLKFPIGPSLGATLSYDKKNTQLILVGVSNRKASRNYLPLESSGTLEWKEHDSKLTGNWSDPFLIRSVIFEDIQLFLPVYQRLSAKSEDRKLYFYIP